MTMARLQEIIIILYACSILLYFIDFVQQNRKANKIAFLVLLIVWGFQTIFLFVYMFHTGRFPVLTLFEGLYFYAWVLITLSVAIHRILKVDFTIFFTNIIGFTIMAIYTFTPLQMQSAAMAEKLVSELLLIHIVMAILSYGAFSLSFVFSALYLLQHHLLKEKKWGQRLWRLSDLSLLERLSYVLNALGVPILVLSLILGLRWAFIKLPNFYWYDPKIGGSFIIIVMYSIFLHLHSKKEMAGKTLAAFNVMAFLVVMVNFFLISRLSLFHFWYA